MKMLDRAILFLSLHMVYIGSFVTYLIMDKDAVRWPDLLVITVHVILSCAYVSYIRDKTK